MEDGIRGETASKRRSTAATGGHTATNRAPSRAETAPVVRHWAGLPVRHRQHRQQHSVFTSGWHWQRWWLAGPAGRALQLSLVASLPRAERDARLMSG